MDRENASRTAMFAVFSTTLTPQRLQNIRRMLKNHIAESGKVKVDLRTRRVTSDQETTVSWVIEEGQGLPVVIIDEDHPHPRSAPWLRQLREALRDLGSRQRPRLIYVTGQPDARGAIEAEEDPLIHEYLGCRDNARLIQAMAAAVIRLLADGAVASMETVPEADIYGVVGQSAAIRKAATELALVLRAPCGLVTGPVGTGKIHLIRTLWSTLRVGLVDPKQSHCRLVVLSCGSLFKEFSFGGNGRLCVGTRDVIEQTCFKSHLDEAQNGLLVLHHVEQLPWAAQNELADVLEKAAANKKRPTRLEFIMEDGDYPVDTRLVGTSELSPAELWQSKRIVPDLFRRLSKYHVAVPPLTQRTEDIPALSADILRGIASRMQLKDVPVLDEKAVRLLADTAWPKNISDLVRVLERAMAKCRKGAALTEDVLREAMCDYFLWSESPKTWTEQIAAAEKDIIRRATVQAGRTVNQAAKDLKKNAKWLFKKIKDLGLNKEIGIRSVTQHKRTPLKGKEGPQGHPDR